VWFVSCDCEGDWRGHGHESLWTLHDDAVTLKERHVFFNRAFTQHTATTSYILPILTSMYNENLVRRLAEGITGIELGLVLILICNAISYDCISSGLTKPIELSQSRLLLANHLLITNSLIS
jgi:hypothetical protein